MSDINWRDIQQDETIFEAENSKRGILIRTDVADWEPRSTVCTYVDYYTHVDRACQEEVRYYAFL